MIAEFSIAKFNLENPRGVLVITPPSQGDGRGEINYAVWRTFALKHNLALVGCFFRDAKSSWVEGYCDGDESGKKLLEFLDEKLPSKPPIYLWGFSAGGQFNYEFTVRNPGRVAAFVVNKGGVYYTAMANVAAQKVPGLFIIGERDADWRKDIVKGIFGLNRTAGAEWLFYEELETGHAVGQSEKLGLKFFGYALGEKL